VRARDDVAFVLNSNKKEVKEGAIYTLPHQNNLGRVDEIWPFGIGEGPKY